MSTRKNGLVSRQKLAVALAVHTRTTHAWEKIGMPRDRSGLFSIEACKKWRLDHDASRAESIQARARRERAQALLAEQTVAIRARDLVRRVDAERAWRLERNALARNLRAWVKPLSRRLMAAAKDGLPGVATALDDAAHKKLQELARR